MQSNNKFYSTFKKIQNFAIIKSVTDGLINMIPVLSIGAIALILKTFPLQFYQTFITTFLGGFLYTLFDFVYNGTFGVLAVFMTFSISRSYMKTKSSFDASQGGAVIASLISFFILTGAYLPQYGLANMGPKSMFIAIITGIGASALYLRFYKLLNKNKKNVFSESANWSLNRMLSTIFPITIVVLIFAFVNAIITLVFDVESFHKLYINILNSLFYSGEVGFFKGFFFVLLSSILWFFGIHGSDALEGVMERYFTPGLAQNQEILASGGVPNIILTKEFFDCFVMIGGCGSALCLLIAILIFSKNRSRRGIALTATFPMIFNINELMIFGLPVIFNPILLIPFLTVPLVSYSVAYLALSTGLVPIITSEVAWATPAFIGGYYATGSIAGSILQLVNLVLGIAIYLPFVLFLDKETTKANNDNYENFLKYFKENEQKLQHSKLTTLDDAYGNVAKELCVDIKHDLIKNLVLYYQPQHHYSDKCIGVEALLRWKHPTYGMIYPPLVVKLIQECDMLEEFEEAVVKKIMTDREKILNKFGQDIKISLNITAATIVTDEFLNFLRQYNKTNPFKDKNICIEVTEQSTLELNDRTDNALREIHDMGLLLAIDDFSMGQTSIHYLEHNLFDIIKIDGTLTKGLTTNPNCREIILSITDLAYTLQMITLAEYVETEEEKEILHSIGCDYYQGYLYSPAVPLDDVTK